MTVWARLDRGDKMALLSVIASFLIWYSLKGKHYVR